MLIRTEWRAVARRGYLASNRPWRAAAYLLTGVAAGALTLLALAVLALVGVASTVLLVGIPLLGAYVLAGIPVAAVERRRLRLVDARPRPSPHRLPDRPGLGAWLRLRYREQATWRELAHASLLALVLWPLDLAAVGVLLVAPVTVLLTPVLLATAGSGEVKVLKLVLVTTWWQAAVAALIGAVALAGTAHLVALWAAVRAGLTVALLAVDEQGLADRVTELVSSRARLVDAFEAERRRIERDLHDGAQQQIVALGMTLGLARVAPPPEVDELVARAHEQAKTILADLGALIRGIHPRVLSDRGLPAAVGELADRSAVPVDVEVRLPRRLPAAVEAAAYFVVAEGLANVGKHSGAARVAVTGQLAGDRLLLAITDDGRGGADAARGTGLTGLADRVAVVDGRLSLSSPPGGPTTLSLEIPCARTAASAP